MQATILSSSNDGDNLFPLIVTTNKPLNEVSGQTTSFRVVDLPWDHPAGAALREAQVAEINARFGNADTPPGIPPSASNITLFLVAYTQNVTDNPEPVACGAVRDLDDGYMEIKRMYAAASARGTGASLAVLVSLEHCARRVGAKGLKLETAVLQPDAIRFYTKYGYQEIPRFGYYENVEWSRCFQKTFEVGGSGALVDQR